MKGKTPFLNDQFISFVRYDICFSDHTDPPSMSQDLLGLRLIEIIFPVSVSSAGRAKPLWLVLVVTDELE